MWLNEQWFFNMTFSKTVIALLLTAVFFTIFFLTYHWQVQLYFFAKFGIKTTKAEAKYLDPLLGTDIGFDLIIWYPLNELRYVPREKKRKSCLRWLPGCWAIHTMKRKDKTDMIKKFFALLLFAFAAAAFAQEGEAVDPETPGVEAAPDSADGKRYGRTGLGDDDFTRSLQATMRGEDLYNAGQYEAALEAFNNAIELMPDNMYAAWIGRGNLYYFVYKDYEKALADYTEVIRRVPEDYVPYQYEFIRRSAPGQVFFAYYGRANVYADRGEHEKALADYTAAIGLWPEHSSPWLFRAGSYAALGEDERAIADYTRGIALLGNARQIDPLNLTAAYIDRAELYKKGQRYEEALADYAEAIRRGGLNLPTAYNNRGIVHRLTGEPDRAIADYDEALRLDPGFAEAYNNRGNTRRDKGELDQAIADYNEAVRLKANYAAAYNNRGVAFRLKGEPDRAIADYDQAIRLDGEYSDAYFNRGVTYYRKGDYDRAIADFDQAIRLDPEAAAAYNNRGVAYYYKGDYDRARVDWEQTLRLEPGHAGAREGLERLRELEQGTGDRKQ
jgi:tetratricopeptide (TPR) repeat protein